MLELKTHPISVEPLRAREENELATMADAARLFFHRRYKIIVMVALCVFVAGVAYLTVAQPSFTAVATINVVNREGGFLQQQATLADAPIDQLREISLAKSSAVAERAVKTLQLDKDPEFNVEGGLASKLRALSALWSGTPVSPELSRLISAVLAVQAKTRIIGVGAGSSFEIDFTSPAGAKAADIANALADAFIEVQNVADTEIRQKANVWLIDQSNEFRKRAEAANRRWSNSRNPTTCSPSTGSSSISRSSRTFPNNYLTPRRR